MKTIGILALQGDFDAHRKAVERAGGHAVEVRTAQELDACDGLIVPGGESTTMLKLLDIENLIGPLRQFAAQKPVFGTCAGAILLAHSVTGPTQPSLDLIDIDVERNAYGRQIDSRVAHVDAAGQAWKPSSFARRKFCASAPAARRSLPTTAIRCGWSRAGTW